VPALPSYNLIVENKFKHLQTTIFFSAFTCSLVLIIRNNIH
jgi:hypothetical protein